MATSIRPAVIRLQELRTPVGVFMLLTGIVSALLTYNTDLSLLLEDRMGHAVMVLITANFFIMGCLIIIHRVDLAKHFESMKEWCTAKDLYLLANVATGTFLTIMVLSTVAYTMHWPTPNFMLSTLLLMLLSVAVSISYELRHSGLLTQKNVPGNR